MRLKCPLCGDRALEEFSYRGDATVRRPCGAGPTDLKGWLDYVYFRDNPKGRHREHWQHTGGCRAWISVERDTGTHDIFAVRLARDPTSEAHGESG